MFKLARWLQTEGKNLLSCDIDALLTYTCNFSPDICVSDVNNYSYPIHTGPRDILEHKLHLILGLLWQLILRYQMNEADRNTLLKWFNAILPGRKITNFTTDWVNGANLAALLEYCHPTRSKPSLPISPGNTVVKISQIMDQAKRDLGIPKLLDPEDLVMSKPSERSVMIYLSYFCGESSPAQRALLSWIQEEIGNEKINNFSTAWVDGRALGALTNALSNGSFPEYKEMTAEQAVQNCEKSMAAAEKLLGVERMIPPEEFANPRLNQIERMTYLMQFRHIGQARAASIANLHVPDKAGSGEMVWLDLDCPIDSSGTLEVGAKRNKGEHVPVRVDRLASNKYRIKYEVKQADKYTLDICFGGKQMRGAPFCIDLTMPEIELTNTITPLKTQSPVLIFCKLSRAHKGEITAQVEGELSGSHPVRVEWIAPEEYKVSFNPPEPDLYTVSMLLDGKPLNGSPFVIPLHSIAQPEKVKCNLPVLAKIRKPVLLEVDVSEAGQGELVAMCKGEECGEVEVKISGTDDQPNGIIFTPLMYDLYTVSVLYAGVEVQGSPFEFDLRADAEEVITLEQPTGGFDTKMVSMCIDTSNAGRGTMEIVCNADEAGEIPVIVEELSSEVYSIKLTPPQLDIYTLSVLLSGAHIPGSPFTVDLATPDASKCKIVGAEATPHPLAPPNLVNEEINFIVNAQAAGKGTLDVQIETTPPQLRKEAPQTNIKVTEEKTNVYSFKYKPTRAGTHRIHILWEDVPIPNSPLTFSVVSPQVFTASPIVLDLATDDMETLRANAICRESGTQQEISITKGEEGNMQLSFKPQQAGMYFIHVQNEATGNEISGSPMVVNYTKEAFPEACKVTGFKKTASSGEPFTFNIDTKQAGYGTITVSTQSVGAPLSMVEETDTAEPGIKVTNIETGMISTTYIPKSPGEEEISVRFAGVPIPGSPFRIAISDPSHECHARGEGLVSAIADEWNNFLVHTPGDFSRKLTVNIEGEGEILEPTITAVNENDYEVVYQPHKSGTYYIEVLWGNAHHSSHIPGSVFEITCKKKIAPSQLSVSKEVQTFLGKSAQFAVVTDTEADGELSILATSAENEILLGKTEKNNNHTYTCTVDLPKLGTYKVHICWDGEEVNGSPFDFRVVPPPTSKDFRIKGAKSNQDAVTLLVQGPNHTSVSSELTASLQTAANTEDVPITKTQASNGKFLFQFQLKERCDHLVSIKFKDNHIKGSPFKLVPTGMPQCHAKGKGLLTAQTGQWNKFSVCTTNAGLGSLSVEIKGEGEEVDPLISAVDETHYEVRYQPLKSGNYTISIQWDGKHIPKSPFQVYCCNPARYSILQPRRAITLGKAVEITVKAAKDTAQENIKIYSCSNGKKTAKGKVTKNASGNYLCSIEPPETDACNIHVRCNGFEVQGSPFKVKILPPPTPETVKAYGPGLQDGTVGQGTFTIEVADAGYGFLSYRVQGPKGGYDLRLSSNPDNKGIITAQYNPTVAGVYKITLLWAGSNIPGSPFIVNISDKT